MVSCACAANPVSAAASNAKNLISTSSIDQVLFIHPSYTKIDRLLQELGLSLVVVRRALDDAHRLVLARRGVVDDAGVRLRHGIVGRVLDGEHRRGHVPRTARSLGVGVVGGPS